MNRPTISPALRRRARLPRPLGWTVAWVLAVASLPIADAQPSAGWDPYSGNVQAGLVAWPSGAITPEAVLQPIATRLSERLWFRGEYLYWQTEGMGTPPLVTTSPTGTAQDAAGILGEPGTLVLFGGQEINDDPVSGLRAKVGFWITNRADVGIEGEFFGLDSQTDSWSGSGSGAPILARPFFDMSNDRQSAQLISFPGLVEGGLRVGSESELRSYLINGRIALVPTCVTPPGGPLPDRVDWILGYRALRLDDRVDFAENLNSLDTSAPGQISLSESFQTENRFDGLQLGVVHQARFSRGWLESALRVAVGNQRQRVKISGGTAITEGGVTERFRGGLLAQRSNIGVYERESFTLVPELGFTLGLRIFAWLDATVGYSVLYLPSVVRAGDQIDTDLNPNLVPEEADPFSGSLRPAFRFVESDYWAHGISFGGEIRL